MTINELQLIFQNASTVAMLIGFIFSLTHSLAKF